MKQNVGKCDRILSVEQRCLSSSLCLMQGIAMQVPSSQPVLVLASCSMPPRDLPQVLLDFFRSPAPVDNQCQQRGEGFVEMHAPSAEANERAMLRCAKVAAHRIAAAGEKAQTCMKAFILLYGQQYRRRSEASRY